MTQPSTDAPLGFERPPGWTGEAMAPDEPVAPPGPGRRRRPQPRPDPAREPRAASEPGPAPVPDPGPGPDPHLKPAWRPVGFPPQPPHDREPKRGVAGLVVVVAVLALAVPALVSGLIGVWRDADETPTPTPRISHEPYTPPVYGPEDKIAPSDGPRLRYRREVTVLTDVEKFSYGQLKKGDCLSRPMEDGDYDSDTLVAPVVDCAQPHTDQVMGFVDVSEDMPDDAIEYEYALARRCNSLEETLYVPKVISMGVKARYPDSEERAKGVAVAICYVPAFHTTWTGSTLDGTAVVP